MKTGVQKYGGQNWRLFFGCLLAVAGTFAPASLIAEGVTEEWVARYNGPGNDIDRTSAMVVDAGGNVYVTGSSYGSGSGNDYATIKYHADGVEQWVARYSGPGNRNDVANALTVDANGNVYVTGYSYVSSTNSDYATIKYDANGVEQWVARYNGPVNEWDYATAMAVDADGNIYVTGSSYGSGSAFDYATVKYDADGVEQWVARYNGPGNSIDEAAAVAVDAVGNVYVTGNGYHSGIDFDYATVKYDADGVEQWVVRYNGPENLSDVAIAMAVDANGNVYVTGYSYFSSTNSDYATVKYDAGGVEQWVARYDGPGNGIDRAAAMTVDKDGNVRVTGLSYGSGSDYDYATVKYRADGVEQWVARYNGPANNTDKATAMAADADGNVYVAGNSRGSGSGYDYATVKYDADGVEQWVARYNGPGNSDYATAMAADAEGNVYVTGLSYSSGSGYDYATIKYSKELDPVTAIDKAVDAVIGMELEKGIETSLVAKLDAALQAITDHNEKNDLAACSALGGFIDAVVAQSGKKIDSEDALDLINAIENIRSALTCM